MSSNIYVGNLTFSTSSADLEQLFSEYGEVTKAQVINDRDTGRSRGFGFVEMEDDDRADAASKAMNGTGFQGRKLVVNSAKSKARRG